MSPEPRAGGARAPRGHKQRLGLRGEQLAADWYVAHGYQVVARNWRCREGEIDIVLLAADGDLVFCEVKTRSSDRFGVPAEAVTPAKQRRLRTLAARYLAAKSRPPSARRGVRFDVAAVMGDHVEVIEAAF